MSTFRDMCVFLLTFILVREKRARLSTFSKILVAGRGREGVAFQSFGELCAKDLHSESTVRARERSRRVLRPQPSPPELLCTLYFGREGRVSGWDAAGDERWGKAAGRCRVPLSRARARPAPTASASPDYRIVPTLTAACEQQRHI